MRSLLIQANPSLPGSSAEAWISMNCYLRGAKGGEVCSEQVSFLSVVRLLAASRALSFPISTPTCPCSSGGRLISDHPIDGKLWRWVDRLLFDSQAWSQPKEQLELVEKIASITEARTVICDLNWARALPLRQAVAGIFDASCVLPELQSLKTLQIDYAPGFRSTALLFVGWLADRLGWLLTLQGANPQFQDARGNSVSVELREKPGSSISRFYLESANAQFEVVREKSSDVFLITAKGDNFP